MQPLILVLACLVLEMLKEVVSSANPSESGSVSSGIAPPVRTPHESLRREVLKKRLGLTSPSSAPQLVPSPQRGIEMLAVGEIRPSPTSKTVPPVSVNVDCLINASTLPHRPSASSSSPRRRLTSDSRSERPSSVYGILNFPLAQDLKDFMSIDDVRLEKARFVTEYLAGDEGRHLLHENKEMAESVSTCVTDGIGDILKQQKSFTRPSSPFIFPSVVG